MSPKRASRSSASTHWSRMPREMLRWSNVLNALQLLVSFSCFWFRIIQSRFAVLGAAKQTVRVRKLCDELIRFDTRAPPGQSSHQTETIFKGRSYHLFFLFRARNHGPLRFQASRARRVQCEDGRLRCREVAGGVEEALYPGRYTSAPLHLYCFLIKKLWVIYFLRHFGR